MREPGKHSHFPETHVLKSILLKWRPIYHACNFCKRLCCVFIRIGEASLSIVFRDHIFEYMTVCISAGRYIEFVWYISIFFISDTI